MVIIDHSRPLELLITPMISSDEPTILDFTSLIVRSLVTLPLNNVNLASGNKPNIKIGNIINNCFPPQLILKFDIY